MTSLAWAFCAFIFGPSSINVSSPVHLASRIPVDHCTQKVGTGVHLDRHRGTIRKPRLNQSVYGQLRLRRQLSGKSSADLIVFCRVSSSEKRIRGRHSKHMPQRSEFAMSGIPGHRIENVIMKVEKIDAIAVVVTGVAVRRSYTQRFPANRIDDQIELGLCLVWRMLRNLDRVHGDRSAIDVSQLVLRLTRGHAACQYQAQRPQEQ